MELFPAAMFAFDDDEWDAMDGAHRCRDRRGDVTRARAPVGGPDQSLRPTPTTAVTGAADQRGLRTPRVRGTVRLALAFVAAAAAVALIDGLTGRVSPTGAGWRCTCSSPAASSSPSAACR